MSNYKELSSVAQNSYADLFGAVTSLHVSEIASINGGFVKKTVRNNDYWYFQYRDIDQSIKQIYVGPESDALKNLKDKISSLNVSKDMISRMSAASIKYGCNPFINKHINVIRRLSEYGFFKNGGILVGTHAFSCMCNMLGIEPKDSVQTQDIDFAHAGNNISVAFNANAEIKTYSAIESLNMGMIPFPASKNGLGPSFLNPSDPAFRIDFLTTKTSTSDEPVIINNLGLSLQPLKFMEFSLVDTLQAVAIGNNGSVLVNIPKPDRFAIHKLIICNERSDSEFTKTKKDIRQAEIILDYYFKNKVEDMLNTLEDANGRGPGWRKRLKLGIKSLRSINPELADFLAEHLAQVNKKDSTRTPD